MKQRKNNLKTLYFTEDILRIMNRLLEYPLIIVEAPMGYGKTTFVRESLKTINADVLWQKVYNQEINGFWKHFCRKFEAIDQEAALNLTALGPPCDNTLTYEVLSLLEDMRLQKDTILVIDDFHLVDSKEINNFIELLVKCEIPLLHLILIARYTGLHNIEELKLKGYLLHIKKKPLNLTKKI